MGFLNSTTFIILSLIIHQCALEFPVVAAKDVLVPGDELDSLNSSSILVSSGNIFTLGFFTMPATTLTYLGIWHTNDDQARKVWVANRDQPMDSSGTLKIDSSGVLKVNRGDITLFNVSDQVGSGNTTAMLLDSSNLVVHDATMNRTIWQSFDYPTDTLLPGMELVTNFITGQNMTLTSWLSEQVPASGDFTLSLDEDSMLVMHFRGQKYWSSGSWYGRTFRFLNFLVSPSNRFQNNLSLVYASDEVHFSFQTIGTNLSMLQLTPDGRIRDVANSLFSTRYQNSCYGYDSLNSCANASSVTCRHQSDRFEIKRGDWYDYESYYHANSSVGDCMKICWNDCECSAFYMGSNDTGCTTWNAVGEFRPDNTGLIGQQYVLVSQKPPKRKNRIWIVVPLAIVLTSALAACLCYMKIRRRRLEEEEQKQREIQILTGPHSFNYQDELEKRSKDAPDVKIFSLGAILVATDNFSDQNKLGQGGYGPVYKGELLDGRAIAVKKAIKGIGTRS